MVPPLLKCIGEQMANRYGEPCQIFGIPPALTPESERISFDVRTGL